MGQSFSRSSLSVSQKATDDRTASFDARLKSTQAGNLSSNHILRRNLFHYSNYSPPATYGSPEKVDAGNTSVKSYDIAVPRPACFVRLPSNSRSSPPLRPTNITLDRQDNIYKKIRGSVIRRQHKPLTSTRRPLKPSIPHEFHFQPPSIYPTPDDWWELLPAHEARLDPSEICTAGSEQVVIRPSTLRRGSENSLSGANVPISYPVSLSLYGEPPLNSVPPSLTGVYDISPIMNIIDQPPSLIEFVPDKPSASEQRFNEIASDSGRNMESCMVDIIQPYFFKASAYMALSHGQSQHEAWGEITVHLRLSLKGKIVAPPKDQKFFSIERLYQLLEEQQAFMAGLVEYLRDIAVALNLKQLMQYLAQMFGSII